MDFRVLCSRNFSLLTCRSFPLQRTFKITTASIEGGRNLEAAAKDLEQQHKAVAQQLSDFDTMKKSLMRDLQDRCEKVMRFGSVQGFLTAELTGNVVLAQVVELEISLDEARENYRNLAKNSNSKTQQRKMDFLTRNLDQLTVVQKQVSRCPHRRRRPPRHVMACFRRFPDSRMCCVRPHSLSTRTRP